MNLPGAPEVTAINASSAPNRRPRVTRNLITRKTAKNHFIETPSFETGDPGAVDLATR
jgi:hypothetical protein